MRLQSAKAWMIAAWILVLTLSPTLVSAESHKEYARSGFYLGLSLPYNTIGGDFDGETVLSKPGEVSLVPKVDDDTGFGVLVGKRYSNYSLELSYLRSEHEVSFQGAKGEAEYHIVSFDSRYYFGEDRKVQPYLLLGMSFPWLVVKDGSATFNSVGDVRFSGIGLNFGSGVAYYLHPRLPLNMGIVYRLIGYTSAKGASGDVAELEDILFGGGLSFNTSMTFTF